MTVIINIFLTGGNDMKKFIAVLLVMAISLTVFCSVGTATGIDSETGIVNGTIWIASDFSDVDFTDSYFWCDPNYFNELPYLEDNILIIPPQHSINGDCASIAGVTLKENNDFNIDIRFGGGGDGTYSPHLQIVSDNIEGNNTPKVKMWSEGSVNESRQAVTGLYVKLGNAITVGKYSFEADVYAPEPRTLRYIISRCPEFTNTWQASDETGGYVIPDGMSTWKKLRIDLDVDTQRVTVYLNNELQSTTVFYDSKVNGYPPSYFGVMSLNGGPVYIDNVKFTKVDGTVQLSLNKSNLTEIKNSESDSIVSITGTNTSESPFDVYAVLGAYDANNKLIGLYSTKRSISTDGSVADANISISNICYSQGNNIQNVAILKMFAWDSFGGLSPYIQPITVKDDTNLPVFLELSNGMRNHEWYTGDGFFPIDGPITTTNTVTYNAAEAGEYEIRVRYANGTTETKTLSLYVNGEDQKQLSFLPPVLPNNNGWETWSDVVTTVTLQKGENTIFLRKDDDDTGMLNVDEICIRPIVRN